ncbi:MAG TPA: DUF4197 domain-containing protein [Limnobacter sp.]|uniref:DUF4197 domain-containing protein n=1 Tax=Limnobacter sp. TaxID=2003368 RepID=UPI002ED88475
MPRMPQQLLTSTCRLAAVAVLSLAGTAWAADLSNISNTDAASALRTTLSKGAESAVASLGKSGGFLNNPAVHIPLPPAVESSKKMLKMVGMSGQLDTLETSMNQAAEAAVPQAKTLLQKAIQNMSVQDAKQVLQGGDTAVTDFFRSKTQADLTTLLMPIVKAKTAQVGVTQQYNALAEKGSKFGLLKPEEANLDGYVTGKALDGLYHMIAEEEKSIRANPAAAGASILKKVFGG